jgi:hypothetical protein
MTPTVTEFVTCSAASVTCSAEIKYFGNSKNAYTKQENGKSQILLPRYIPLMGNEARAGRPAAARLAKEKKEK